MSKQITRAFHFNFKHQNQNYSFMMAKSISHLIYSVFDNENVHLVYCIIRSNHEGINEGP